MKGTYEKDSDVILFAQSSLCSFLDCLGGAGCTGNDVNAVNLSGGLAGQRQTAGSLFGILLVVLIAVIGVGAVQRNCLNLAVLDNDIDNQIVRIKVLICIRIDLNSLGDGLGFRLLIQLILCRLDETLQVCNQQLPAGLHPHCSA